MCHLFDEVHMKMTVNISQNIDIVLLTAIESLKFAINLEGLLSIKLVNFVQVGSRPAYVLRLETVAFV